MYIEGYVWHRARAIATYATPLITVQPAVSLQFYPPVVTLIILLFIIGQAWGEAIKGDLFSWNNPRGNPGVNTKSQPISKQNENLHLPIKEEPDGRLNKNKHEQEFERLSEKTVQPNLVHDDL